MRPSSSRKKRHSGRRRALADVTGDANSPVRVCLKPPKQARAGSLQPNTWEKPLRAIERTLRERDDWEACVAGTDRLVALAQSHAGDYKLIKAWARAFAFSTRSPR